MDNKKDELKGRFTAWLEVVVKRAKIDYIRKQKRRRTEVSIEDKSVIDTLTYQFDDSTNTGTFDFDNEVLSNIFVKLSPGRQKILTMLFVHNLTAEEIAAQLGCSVQYVYNQRSTALKELRKRLIR